VRRWLIVALALFLAASGLQLRALAPAGAAPVAGPAGSGYWMLDSAGHVYAFGAAGSFGEPAVTGSVDIEPAPDGRGYWVLGSGGGISSFGSAAGFGSGAPLAGDERYVSMSATPTGNGYWLFTNRGRVVARGAAAFLGDMSGTPLNGSILDSVATPSGRGYWMVASDGGIFSFGDARFFGSMGGTPLNQPVVSMAPDPDGVGYWLVAGDGGIFAFDAPFYGSMGGKPLNKQISAIVGGARGYLMVARDGGIFAFGDTQFHGSLGANPPPAPVVSVGVLFGDAGASRTSTPPTTTPPTTGPTTTTTGPGDTTAPQTALTDGPTGTIASTDVSFSFSSSETTSTFSCRLDSGAPAPCQSPRSYAGLADGSHTFTVAAVDEAGNADATPASRTFTVDATAPDTTIDSGPSGTIRATAASFTFFADEPAARFDCRFDSDEFAPCTSPMSYSDLTDGTHTFEVMAGDAVGNTEPTPASRSFVVDTSPDTVPPDTLIDSGPSGLVSSSSARFTFSSTEESSTFECRIDDAEFAACTSPASYSGLTTGAHTFEVRSTDISGNTDLTPAPRAWNYITDPSLFSDGFEGGNLGRWTLGVGGDGSARVQGDLVKRGRFAARLSASSNPASAAYARWTAASPQPDLSAAGDFQVTAEGGVGSNVPILRFLDPSGAVVVSLFRQNQAGGRLWVQHSDSVYDMTSGTLALATWSRFDVHVVAAGEAASTIEVRQDGVLIMRTTVASLDLTGIKKVQIGYEVAAQTQTVVVDDVAIIRGTSLDTLIDSAPSGSLAVDEVNFAFSSTDAGSVFECSLDIDPFVPCASPMTYSGLLEGDHMFSVRALNGSGDPDDTPAFAIFTIDRTAPQTTTVSGPAETSTVGTASLVFESSEGDGTFECRVDAAPFVACTSPLELSGLAEGLHTFDVRARDEAGNVDPTPATRSWTVDTPALFSDGFEHNTFTGWTTVLTGGDGQVSLSDTLAAHGAFSGRLSATANPGSFAYARWAPDAPLTDLSVAGDFRITAEGSPGNNTPIFRLFGPAGPLVTLYRQNQDYNHVWVQHSGSIYDLVSSPLPLDTWAHFDLHVITAGDSASTIEVRMNGALVFTTTTASINPGGIAKIQIGAEQLGQAIDLVADDISVIRGTQPDTVIDSGPTGIVADSTATFTFSSPDASAGFACRLDDGDSVPCSSPAMYSDLAEGPHALVVTATNAAGNPDPTPAVRRWTHRLSGPPDKLLIADHRNQRLLITDFDGNLIWKWDNPTGRSDTSSGPLGVRWMPGNRILATFGTGEVGLIDVATKTFVWKTSGYNEDFFRSPYEAELLPDGNLAVAMRFNSGGRVDVYDMGTGQLVWRRLLPHAHAVTYRTAEQSENSPYPTLLVGGWGVTEEVAYAPYAGESGQTQTWAIPTEFTHAAIVLDNNDVLTTEGYYFQRLNRAGQRVWSIYTGEGQEDRRVGVMPDGSLVLTGAEASRIEFRSSVDGALLNSWSVLDDGSGVNYPYGIQVIDYLV
jgi:hypothetical protein